jgi:hypothetical protein
MDLSLLKFTTMKTIFTFLSLMTIMTSGFAQGRNDNGRGQGDYGRNNNGQYNNYKSSALVVNAYTNSRVTVVVDNNLQYQANGNGVDAGILNPGVHNIVVYQWRSNFWGKQKREVLYSSSLCLKPNTETAVNINSFGRVNIIESPLYQNNQYGYDRDKKHHDHDDRDRRDDDHGRNGGRY